MSMEECVELLMVIDACYPNFNVRPEDVDATSKAWFKFMKDYDYNTMETALKIFVNTSGSAFAPSVSELIAAAAKPRALMATDVATAWTQVRKAIRRGIYNSAEEFEKLPELAKQVVGSHEQLITWAQMQSSEIDTVVWSNFKRSYETLQKRQDEIAAMPAEIRNLIQSKQQMMIEGRS